MANGTSRRPAIKLAALLVLWLVSDPASALQGGGEVAAASQEAAGKLAEAEAAAAAAVATERHPDYLEATRRDGEISVALIRARRLLETARNAFAGAEQRGARSAFKDAGLVAGGAVREFGKFERRTAKVLAEIAAESGRPGPTPPPAPSPPPPTTKTEPASDGEGPPPPPPPRRQSSSPPRKLIQAADAYLAGDYQGAIAILGATRYRSGKTRAHLHLLRAASRYALFLLGGEDDYGLRGEAIEDVLACRRADASLVPGEDLFSPRFRQFFAATE